MRGDGRGSQYSPLVAFIFIFNLVVGTGVLALPSVLIKGGWLLGGTFLVLVSFLSYVSLTFVLEAMATANAIICLQDELLPCGDTRMFQISKRTELGEMAGLYFNHWGRIFFYAVLILYLFGDTVIYITLVTRSLAGLVYGDDAPAWAFDTFLCLFVGLMLPFCFFDFQKTQALQVVTLCIRNAALATMICLAFKEAPRAGFPGKEVPVFRLAALTNLFGGAVYSFMCHHSLPGIVTPMRDKAQVLKISAFAFSAVLAMYMLLFISCGLAFGFKVRDPVTFNFPPEAYGLIGDALLLFPVFTLSSTFPMLAITLRNNLDSLLQLIFWKGRGSKGSRRQLAGPDSPRTVASQTWAARHARIWLTLLAVLPPTFCSLVAEHAHLSVDELVGMTGAFAGCAVMFIIPASLVFCSRKTFARLMEDLCENEDPVTKDPPPNMHASPFSGDIWVFTILGWATIAILFNAYEKLFK